MPAPLPSAAAFLESYPEFSKTPASLLDSKLLEASRRTNGDIYGDVATAETAVMLRAAILMAKSPYSIRMKLADDDMSKAWKAELYEMQRSAAVGWRVF